MAKTILSPLLSCSIAFVSAAATRPARALDQAAPLASGSHADAVAYSVQGGKLVVKLKPGSNAKNASGLADPAQFAEWSGRALAANADLRMRAIHPALGAAMAEANPAMHHLYRGMDALATSLPKDELPESLRGLELKELNTRIEEAAKQRAAIQAEIATLNKERESFVAAELKKQAAGPKTFDEVMVETTRAAIGRVLHGTDDRLVAVVGPCSIHDYDAALAYARLLAAQAHRLEPELVHALISVESGYQANAISEKGAIGLMQVLPETAQRYGIRDPAKSVRDNLKAGTLYLKDLMQMFNGRLELVLAAYNAGENVVLRYGMTIPPYPETQRYVPAVLAKYSEMRPPVVAPVDTRIEYLPGTRLNLTK
mgnify:CR=1 FL=1